MACIAAAVAISSCTKPQTKEENFCRVLDQDRNAVESISLRKSESERTYCIESNGDWKIELPSNATWLTVNPSEGKGNAEISLKATANDGAQRKAVMKVMYGAEALSVPVIQIGGELYLNVSPRQLTSSEPGTELTINVSTNLSEWSFSHEEADWFRIKEKTGDKVIIELTAPMDLENDRQAEFRFYSKEFSEIKRQKVSLTYRRGLMLDVVFNADGSAKDMSSYKRNVLPQNGSNLVTYYDETFGNYIARFNNNPGEPVSTGYYTMNYSNDNVFKSGLADGHSIETVFMFEADNDGSEEIKMFSSHGSGGTGIMLSRSDKGKDITFLPHVGGSYIWTGSKIVPERGKYYHVVGVWDKTKGESRIYVNGELKATVPAAGEFSHVNGVSMQWFGIGADAGQSGEAAWKGDVASARIYDAILDDAAVKALWDKANKGMKDINIHIDDIMFLSGCQLAAGSDYIILGKGFSAGDRICWESLDGNIKKTSEGESSGKSIITRIPQGLESGKYKLILERNGERYALGCTDIIISDNPVKLKAPKIIAHRCYHKNGNTENSLAALKAAQNLGIYGAEIDIYITKDDKIMVHHDGVIAGKRIENCTYDEVKDLKLSNGEKLPLFTDMLEVVKSKPGMKLIIEIKDHQAVPREEKAVDEAIRLVSEYGLENQVEYIAFDYELCKRIARAVPDAMIGYLSGDRDPKTVLDEGIRSIDYNFNTLSQKPEWISQAQQLGMIVNIWTVNSDSDLMKAIAMGVDYITTDNPDRLKEISERFF